MPGAEDAGPMAAAAAAGSGGSMSKADAGPVPFNPVPTVLDASPSPTDCSGATGALVYVLSKDSDLYSFAPDRKAFTKIGTVNCALGQSPNSMAIDRKGMAWVNYPDGTLRSVNTADAHCEGDAVTLSAGWSQDGMTYVTTDASAGLEAFYLKGSHTSGGAGLGLADTATGTVMPIGHYTSNLHEISAELTGTGDGRLFGLFDLNPVTIAEIDRSSAAILSQTPLRELVLNSSSSFAFSFWGGRFYFYTFTDTGGPSSNVAEYDPMSGSLEGSFMTNIGFVIVGAGVSTCAPLLPPVPR